MARGCEYPPVRPCYGSRLLTRCGDAAVTSPRRSVVNHEAPRRSLSASCLLRMFLDVRLHERTFGNHALPPSARGGQGERDESLRQPPGAQRGRHECVHQRDRTRLAPIRKYRRPSLTSDLITAGFRIVSDVRFSGGVVDVHSIRSHGPLLVCAPRAFPTRVRAAPSRDGPRLRAAARLIRGAPRRVSRSRDLACDHRGRGSLSRGADDLLGDLRSGWGSPPPSGGWSPLPLRLPLRLRTGVKSAETPRNLANGSPYYAPPNWLNKHPSPNSHSNKRSPRFPRRLRRGRGIAQSS